MSTHTLFMTFIIILIKYLSSFICSNLSSFLHNVIIFVRSVRFRTAPFRLWFLLVLNFLLHSILIIFGLFSLKVRLLNLKEEVFCKATQWSSPLPQAFLLVAIFRFVFVFHSNYWIFNVSFDQTSIVAFQTASVTFQISLFNLCF